MRHTPRPALVAVSHPTVSLQHLPTPAGAVPTAVSAVLRAQAQAGNRAVSTVIQRTIGDGHDLSSPRFALDDDLEAVFDNEARLTMNGQGLPSARKVESGPAVAKVQEALVQLGFTSVPVSGTYDIATWNAVKQLKRREHLGFETIGDVGPGTMGFLNARFSRTPTPAKTEPTLDKLATVGTGPFATHVAAGILDPDAALLLAAMLRERGTFMADVAQLALDDLASGALAGMVLPANRANLTTRVPAADLAILTGAPSPGGGADYNAFGDARVKGFIMIGTAFFPARNAPLRFQFLVLAHELNHHRNRDQAKRIEKDPAGRVDNPAQYADPALAARFAPGVVHTRKQYAVEIQARHVAWHVGEEYDIRTGRRSAVKAMPAPGALFAACFRFARDDAGAYHDNGYIPALAARGDATLGKQVAQWMTVASQMEFLNLTVASDVVANFFAQESRLARASGFTPTAAPDGLA
ncbi:peptidoglycan-binding domain-containing protein [Agromyces bauzanensis]